MSSTSSDPWLWAPRSCQRLTWHCQAQWQTAVIPEPRRSEQEFKVSLGLHSKLKQNPNTNKSNYHLMNQHQGLHHHFTMLSRVSSPFWNPHQSWPTRGCRRIWLSWLLDWRTALPFMTIITQMIFNVLPHHWPDIYIYIFSFHPQVQHLVNLEI